MQFINYFLAAVLSWLGIIGGVILLKIAPEEKKSLSKIFKAVSNASIVLIFIFAFIYHDSIVEIALLLAYGTLLFFASGKIDRMKILMVSYAVLGLIFYYSWGTAGGIINSCLIFIFGIGMGSQLYNPRKKNYSFLLYSMTFLIVASFMFLIR